MTPRLSSITSPETQKVPSGVVAENIELGRKRRRINKPPNACAQCQQRKSRCDLINENGCHSCRVLKLECSRSTSRDPITSQSTSQPRSLSPSGQAECTPKSLDVPDNVTQQHIEVLRALDERTRLMLGILENLTAPSTTAPRQTFRGIIKRGKRDDHVVHRFGGVEQVNYALHLDSPWILRDPVDVGVVNQDTMDKAVHEFRQQPTILSELLARNPTDPFLLTVIVLSMDPFSQAIRALVDAQMNQWNEWRSTNVEETILGLLILASTPVTRIGGHADPYCAAERAMTLAVFRGLEAESQLWTSNIVDQSYSSETLWRIQLHETLILKARWNDFFTSPTLFQRKAAATRTALARSERLHLERALLDLLSPLGDALSQLKFTRCYHQGLQDNLASALQAFEDAFQGWLGSFDQTQYPLLMLTGLLIRPFIFLRTTTEAVTALPTPLAPQPRLDFLFSISGRILRTSWDVMEHVTRVSLPPTVPPFLQALLFLAFAVIVQSSKVTHANEDDAGAPASSTTSRYGQLDAYRRIVSGMHPKAARVLLHIESLSPAECWSDYQTRCAEEGVLDCLEYFDWTALFDLQGVGPA